MKLIAVDARKADANYCRQITEELENGNILLLGETPFAPSPDDQRFLREQKQSSGKGHKNIAYKPKQNKTTGVDKKSEEDAARLTHILARYSEGALDYLGKLLPHYAPSWKVDYASFRPEEEQGRDLSIKHRNDLMHVDAFPTRPTFGGRILRAFTNIHPTKDRVWVTAESFDYLADTYAKDAGIGTVKASGNAGRSLLNSAAKAIGIALPPERSAYDEFMLGFHHYLKSNDKFQQVDAKYTWAFKPGATWISFTDAIAHSVKSGQYALEQTCIVPLSAMLHPERAPVAVLERIAARSLADES